MAWWVPEHLCSGQTLTEQLAGRRTAAPGVLFAGQEIAPCPRWAALDPVTWLSTASHITTPFMYANLAAVTVFLASSSRCCSGN